MRNIILASGSPRRKELLTQIGIPFEIVKAEGEEIINTTVPEEAVKELSRQKAREVAARTDGDVVIGADTVVAADHEILGKPKDDPDAAGTDPSGTDRSDGYFAGWSQEKRDLFCRDYSRACLSHDRRTDPGLCGKWRTDG